jgi:hypothetical protein
MLMINPSIMGIRPALTCEGQLADLPLAETGSEHGALDVLVIRRGLEAGQVLQRLAVDAQIPGDGVRAEPHAPGELAHVHQLHVGLPGAGRRQRRRKADRVEHHGHELPRIAERRGQLGERLGDVLLWLGEQLVDEGERQMAGFDGGGDVLQGDAGIVARGEHPDPRHVGIPEAALAGSDDRQRAHPPQLIRGDPRVLG